MTNSLPTPCVIAHRGASKYAPENTLAAFTLAVQQGADAVELDTKLTADGEIVVIHDQTVDRTTGATGKVTELTLPALKELEAGSHFDGRFNGEKIPTLDEVFESVGHLLFINVEVANYATPTDASPEKIAAIVSRHALEQRVLFSSFNPLALSRLSRLLPETRRGLLTFPGLPGALLRSRLGVLVPHHALHPEVRDVSQRLVERVHRSGRTINVWTVNDSPTMQKLLEWKVDGIITDDPVTARQVFSKVQAIPR